MSFSSDVKEELARQDSTAMHCQIAEMSAMIAMCGHMISREKLQLQTENAAVSRKYFTLLKKTFNINSTAVRQKAHEAGPSGGGRGLHAYHSQPGADTAYSSGG